MVQPRPNDQERSRQNRRIRRPPDPQQARAQQAEDFGFVDGGAVGAIAREESAHFEGGDEGVVSVVGTLGGGDDEGLEEVGILGGWARR